MCFFLSDSVSERSGVVQVISSKAETVMPRWPGVVGLIFLIAMLRLLTA